MKVIIDDQEVELPDELEKGEKELDMIIPDEGSIDMDNTIEITDDMIEKIQEAGEESYE